MKLADKISVRHRNVLQGLLPQLSQLYLWCDPIFCH